MIRRAILVILNYPAIWYYLPHAWENDDAVHTWRDWWSVRNFATAWDVTTTVYWR